MSFINKNIFALVACYLISILFSSLIYGSSASPTEDRFSGAAEAASTKRLLPTDKAMCLVDFKTDKLPTAISEIALKGFHTKKEKKLDAAMPLLEEAVCYGHLGSMVLLGEIYEERREFTTAYHWYLLAFEENWLNTGMHHSTAKAKLQAKQFRTNLLASLNMPSQKQSQKQMHKFFKFFDDPQLALYAVVESNNPIVMFQSVCKFSGVDIDDCFKANPYLTIEMANLRKLRFVSKAQQLSGSILRQEALLTNPWGAAAQLYLNVEDCENAAVCLERSKSPDCLFNLGKLCQDGKVAGGFEKAALCYRQSGISEAFGNLGQLYVERDEFHLAAECFKRSHTHSALFNLLVFQTMGILNLGDEHARVRQEFLHKVESLRGKEREAFLGRFYMLNREFEEALTHFSEAYSLGDAESYEFIEQINEILKQQENLREQSSFSDDEEVSVDLPQLPAEAQEQPVVLNEMIVELIESDDEEVPVDLPQLYKTTASDEIVGVVDISESTTASADESATLIQMVPSQAKRALTKEERKSRKILRKQEELEKCIRKSSERLMKFSMSQKSSAAEMAPLPIVFINKRVNGDYAKFMGTKAEALVADISSNPFSRSRGLGKPEILQGFKHEGCPVFSREINGKDRLIYSISKGKVVILQCGEHYDD